MYVYPWVLHDEGVERALEKISACGIDTLQLAVNYHIATYLVPRNPRRRLWAGEQGALYFDPRAAGTGAWPVAPPVSAVVDDPSYLPVLLEAAAAHGMGAIAWTVYLYNHALVRRRPDLAVKNAFGDANQAQLCPSHPAVRRYALDLTAAAAGLGAFAGIVCESLSFLPFGYGSLNLKAAVVPGARSRLLLGLCFCEHCGAAVRDAGVEGDGLAAEVRQAIDDDLAGLPDRSEDEDAGEAWSDRAFGGRLRAFLEARTRQATSLQLDVLRVAEAAGLALASTAVEVADERVSGVSSRTIKPRLDELRIEITAEAGLAAIAAMARAARAGAADGTPIYALYQLSGFGSEASFVGAVERAREAGLRHFRFYEYGLLTRRQLQWLRGARHLWSRDAAVDSGERGP
jgi:hypothetical protein